MSYLDPTEIKDEYEDYVAEIEDREEELSEKEILSPAEFREWELIKDWLHDKEIPAENKVNPNTSEWYAYLTIKEIAEIEDFCDEAGIDPGGKYDWDDIGPMIPEYDFEDYAQELAEDIGAISSDHSWPNYCIDWSYAARELAYDYSLVTWRGVDYYVRAV